MQNGETQKLALRKRVTGRALIIFIIMLILLTFFSNTINNLTLPRVTVETPMPGDIVKDISGSGVVEANETFEYYITTSSMVEEVLAKAGDQVKAGQHIMTLDTTDLERSLMDETARYEQKKLQLENLMESSAPGEFNTYEQNVRSAEKRLEQAKKDFEAVMELYELGAESRESMENSQSTLEDAEDAYDTAVYNRQKAAKDSSREIESLKYDIEIQQRKLEDLKDELKNQGSVTAPCDGIITEINFGKGTMATGQLPLFTITDTSKGFKLKVTLDEEKAKYLAVGEEATVTVESMSKMGVKGKVIEISDNEQQKGLKKDVYVEFEAEGLTGGEPGELRAVKRMASNGMLVSNDAIGTDTEGDYIMVVNERDGALGKEYYVEKVNITTGESDSSKTAVTGGTRFMDKVVVNSSKPLEEGDRVIVEK